MPMTPEELELLTEEERAGLEEEANEDVTDDEREDDEGTEQEEDQEGSDEDDAGADDAEGGQDDGAEQDDAATDDDEPRAQTVPLIKANVPDDAKEQLEALETARTALSEKFEDGDLTSKEFMAEVRKLDKQESEIEWQLRKAELAEETTRQQQESKWFESVSDFLTDHPEIQKNELVYNAFDQVVRRVTADEKNHKLSDRKQLDMAYKEWAEALGVTGTPKPKAKSKGKDIPPTLAKVPAAEIETTDDGKYGNLNRLFNSKNPSDVVKAEDLLAKMSEAEQDRFLASH